MKFSREIAGQIDIHDFPEENRKIMEKFGWVAAEPTQSIKEVSFDIPIVENQDIVNFEPEKQNPVNKGGRPKKNK